MNLGTKLQTDSDAVPLHGAVLCVDCECVTNGLSDECLVCGSRSLFSLARLLGGTRLSPKANYSNAGKAVLFDVEIAINLKQIEPRELNAAVEGITNLIVPTLVRGPASFHINVEPVVGCHDAEELKAA